MAQEKTKNLGQVAAIWISSNAPENTKLIWYDIREQCHKVYETSTGEWEALNPQVVTNSTISDLSNIASQSGLSVGKFYYLTDVGTLAIAITTTKVWYVDSLNNYVVNDLASTIVAYINSSNLLIDGSTGVWNNESGRLEFAFSSVDSGENIDTDNDYIVIRRKNNNVWSWVKAKLSGFISAVANNSISWNNGFYFNFNEAVNSIKNIAGGIVGLERHNADLNLVAQSIVNVSNSVDSVETNCKSYTDDATADLEIYGKKWGRPWGVYQNPPNAPGIDATLQEVLTILISWANVLQNSNKIKVGSGFSSNGRSGNVDYSDTVRSAIEKLVYKVNNQSLAGGVKLPSDYNVYDYSGDVAADDDVLTAIGKLARKFNGIDNTIWGVSFDNAWKTLANLGDKIGEFDSQGRALYSACLEGAVYLLSLWYAEHFHNKTNSWTAINGYYMNSRGDGRSELASVCQYKITENTISLKKQQSTSFNTYMGNQGNNILVGNNTDDITLTFKNLPQWVITALIDKYGVGVPFNVGISITGHDVTNSLNPSFFIANGVMYGIVVQAPVDSEPNGYLKLIPFWTDALKDESVLYKSDSWIRVIDKRVVNENGDFGSDWLITAIYSAETWRGEIPPFCIDISLY